MKQYENRNNTTDLKLISRSVSENKAYLEKVFEGCSDIVFREMAAGKTTTNKISVLGVFIDGLIDKEKANSSIFKPLLRSSVSDNDSEYVNIQNIQDLMEKCIYANKVSKISSLNELADAITSGWMVLIIEGFTEAVAVQLMDTVGRDIGSSEGEVSVLGPSLSFNETISDNLGLIRKIIRSQNLKTVEFILGRRTKIKVILTFIDGVADTALVSEVTKRLEKVDIDELQDVRTLDEIIGDDAFSLIPLSRHTERPDIIAASLLEGRVAILVEGTPMGMIIPVVMKDFLEAAEDSYSRFPFGAYVRLLSYIFIFLSLYGSAVFVAFTLMHQEMIPTVLLKFIIQSRSEVPFSTFIEIMLLEIAYELIREGGARLPLQANKAVTIVSTLIVGTLSARVGFISNTTVIIVAVSSIAAFTTPYYAFSISLRLIRFPLIIVASLWGMYGIIGLSFIALIYLSSIRSFGIPILTPFAPMSAGDLKDSIIRLPLKYITNRPFHLSGLNRKRMDRKGNKS